MAAYHTLWHKVHMDKCRAKEKELVAMMMPHKDHIISISMQCREDCVVKRAHVGVSWLRELDPFTCIQHVCIEGALITPILLDQMPPFIKTLHLIRCTVNKDIDANCVYPYELKEQHRGTTKQLEHLYISNCVHIAKINMYMSDIFSNLKKFHLNDISRIEQHKDLVAFVSHLPDTLTEVDISRAEISGCGDDVYMWLRYRCPRLKVLRASNRNDITDDSLKSIILENGSFNSFKSLHELHLNGCPLLTDEGLLSCIRLLPKDIHKLMINLTDCLGISADAVRKVRQLSCPNINIIY